MNSELLSQDDIDNLISQEAMGPDMGGGGSGGSGGGAVSPDALKGPAGIVGEQVSTVLLTVLGKEISVSMKSISAADEGKLNAQFGGSSLIIRADLTQKVNGSLFFVYQKADVAVLADLMMMGDGSAPYEEDHKDAVVELTNQIMGAVCSSFGTTYDVQVGISTPAIEEFSPVAAGLNVRDAIWADMSMKIEDVKEVRFALLFSGQAASDLAALGSRSAAPAMNMGGGGAGGFGGSGDMGGAGGFDFQDMPGAGMPLQNFSQPSGNLANDRSVQFSSTGNPQMDMLLDVTLQVAIELGRTEMSIKKILELGPGSIIELNRMAGEPVDLLVNDKVIAKGEVVVVDENFGIRIVKLISPEERLKNLR